MTGRGNDKRRALVAMSGGVDSSVAAALLVEQGWEVSGVTMKLWGGESDTGCCSVSDVDDARRVAQQLDVPFHVFNFGDDFSAHVVEPYVDAHRRGITPNPCIECNRHLKFDRLLRRADALGFDTVVTGHHARIVELPDGTRRVARGADAAKDQSYVLYMLDQEAMRRTRLPIGDLTKAEVRAHAGRLGLRTAGKADSQDVCFITSTGGRTAFLGDRIGFRPGRLVDSRSRRVVGEVDAVELVTVGQRRGLGTSGTVTPRYALDVDLESATVIVGAADDLLVDGIVLEHARSSVGAGEHVLAQCSAHGEPRPAVITAYEPGGAPPPVLEPGWLEGSGTMHLTWLEPQPRVAPGQSVVLYGGDLVVGGGVAARPGASREAALTSNLEAD